MKMRFIQRFVILLAILVGINVSSSVANAKDPLFINLTTDESHRVTMSFMFGKGQLERGHSLTIFLNDRGVFVGSSASSAKLGDQQKMMTDLISKGASVLICQLCMKHYGIGEATLIKGVQIGNPELTGGALFRHDTKTLTW
jgi:sulfur relay (sulfurtransferase) complex TusBCD TusD component (DsrE family)